MLGFGSPPSRTEGRAEQDDMRLLWKLSGIGFQLLAEILAGIGIGWLIDRLAGTAPRWITIGAIAGVIVGLANFVRHALMLNRKLGPLPRRLSQRGSSAPAADDSHDETDAKPGELAGWMGASRDQAEDEIDDETFTRTLEEELRRARQEMENEGEHGNGPPNDRR